VKDVLATKREIKMGSTGPGSTYDDTPKILNQTIGTKFKVVSGYEGTGPILVAMRRKEVDGGCWGWESARSTGRALFDASGEDKLIPFLIHRPQPDPEVKGLPLIPDIIKGEDNISAYNTWVGTFEFQRPFMLPPGTPKERLQVLRKAFADTMKDPEFMAEAKKVKLEITYVTGEEVEKYVDKVLAVTPRAKELLSFLITKPKK
jgi:tripartite-type tricarboxylate transporter receptor subunit TctC